MRWRQKNTISFRATVSAARNHPRTSPGSIIRCLGDDRKCPCGEQWSELQRDDRIAAECASHQLPRNKFSLFAWQAVAAMAALLHSCLDHQRMLMRRMQGRRSLLQIGPTSRTRDSVWFLFPCRDCDPTRNLSKLIRYPLRIFGPARFYHHPRGMLQSVQRKCSRRILFRRAFASSLRPPPAATSLS
jgi:hypothetical protein